MLKPLAVTAMLVVAGCLMLVSCGKNKSPGGSAALDKSAKQLVLDMAKGDFTAATRNFNPTMQQASPPQKLKSAWDSLVQQVGPFKSAGEVRIGEEQGFKTALVPCVFKKATINAKVVFDRANQVAGLWFLPAS